MIKYPMRSLCLYHPIWVLWGGGGVPRGPGPQPAYAVFHPRQLKNGNSIAFGGAPRREVDSQPISQLDRPAVRQTETHTLGFLLVADTLCSSRDQSDFQHRWWPSGNACHRKLVGWRFEPWCGDYLQRRRRCKSQQARIRTTDYRVRVGYVTIGPAAMLQRSASPLLEAC